MATSSDSKLETASTGDVTSGDIGVRNSGSTSIAAGLVKAESITINNFTEDQKVKVLPLKSGHLNKLSLHIGNKWYSVGRDLEISDKELDKIKAAHRKDGMNEMAYRMLSARKSKMQPDPTVSQFAEVLQDAGHEDLADKLFQIVDRKKTGTKGNIHNTQGTVYSDILTGEGHKVLGPVNIGPGAIILGRYSGPDVTD